MFGLATGVAAGIGFAKGFMGSLNSSNEAAFNAASYQQQAETYRRNARLARRTGAYNEDIYRSKQRAAMASGAAAAGEAGMGESPTTATALATTYNALEQNILSARYQVESEAENYLYQARVADENARQMKKKGKHRFQKALLGGVSGALGVL